MQKKVSASNLVDLIKRLPPVFGRRLLRVAAWGLGAVAVLLLAALLALHAWILPRINDFRVQVEQSASSALGLRVRVGEIATLKQGLQPAVQLRQLRFLDEAGNEGLHVDAVEAEASLWSLLHGRFARLAVLRPVLHAWRQADGRIYVAGLPLPQGPKDAQPAAESAESDTALNWLLAQHSLEIVDGSVQWSDAQRQVPPLAISQVQAKLTNSGRQHRLQLALTPPAGWGRPIAATAEWQHGLWQAPARWNKWSGSVQADIAEIDVSQLRQYVDLGRHVALRQGQGRLQVQAEYREGLRSGLTIQAALQAVDITLGKGLPPLALKGLEGTFKVRYKQGSERDSYTLATEGLAFETLEGLRWSGGQVQVDYHDAESPGARGGEIRGKDWDIGIISQLAGRLPLGEAALKALRRYQPQGRVHDLHVTWQGDINAPSAYSARGQASQIGWRAQAAGTAATPDAAASTRGESNQSAASGGKGQGHAAAAAAKAPPQSAQLQPPSSSPGIGTPGVQGAQIDFDFNQAGGSMRLNLDKGSAEFPGVFAQPRLDFDTLQTQVQWRINKQQIRVTLPEVRFANRDAQGTARVAWRTHDGAKGEERFPGVLDLQGHFQRARAEQVARYLPLSLGSDALDYVGSAVRSGDIRNARVRIEGDLNHIPFGTDAQGVTHPGTFRFDVPLANAEYRFVPRYLQGADEKPWPALTQLNGLLVIDKLSLSVINATARFSSAPDIAVNKLSAHIPRLDENLSVGIAASMHGPLEQALALTNQSPLADMIDNSLAQATASGQADITLALGLPIMRMEKAIVKGSVALQNNDVRISPDSPLLAHSQGKVLFHDKGFALQDVSATLLGGKATLKGGSLATARRDGSHPVRIEAQGDFTGEGLRQEPSVGSIAQLGRFLQGRSAYRATLLVDRGASELSIDSDLNGMAVKLPAPLGKAASGKLPFHFASRITQTQRAPGGAETATQDELDIRFGHVVLAQYARDLRHGHHGDAPRVLRGRVAVGPQAVKQAPPMPDAGVHALVLMDRVDADAWTQVLESGWGDQVHPAPSAAPSLAASVAQTAKGRAASAQAVSGQKPTQGAPGSVAVGLAKTPAAQSPSDGTGVVQATAATPAGLARQTPTGGRAQAAPNAANASANTSTHTEATSAAAETAAGSYLPDQFAMQTPALVLAKRVFESLVVGGTREGRLWKLSLAAKQLNGYVEYLQSATGGPGGVKARLQHLTLAPANVEEVGDYVRQTADPQTLPALDIDAANVDLVGYKFNRIALRASNSAQARPAGADLVDDAGNHAARSAWRIHELTAQMPQARLQGSGVWGIRPANVANGEGRGLNPADLARRFVSLQLNVQTDDLGSTLDHLGHKGLVKAGQGSVAGTLRWQGSPVAFDMETLAGELRLDVRRGHITRIDPGAFKLISLLSLQGLTRLGSIAEKGFAFDRIDGSLRVARGVATTDNLAIAGAMADAKLSGQIALAPQTIDLHVVVQPKVDLSTAALAAGVINPLVGVGSYVAQWVLSKPISAMATQTLHVQGPLGDPAMTRLQGSQAAAIERQVLKVHAAPAAFNPLWDWTPITGRRLQAEGQGGQPGEPIQPPAETPAEWDEGPPEQDVPSDAASAPLPAQPHSQSSSRDGPQGNQPQAQQPAAAAPNAVAASAQEAAGAKAAPAASHPAGAAGGASAASALPASAVSAASVPASAAAVLPASAFVSAPAAAPAMRAKRTRTWP
ncbi:MAG: AsmA-like C-terminal region-containing protein [Brachymonas sp.]|nr:AsmA-like C-terminal region-containing protein [Brachymonas sp.]